MHRARRLLWTNGYDGTTMRELAHACGFDVSNIYRYFKNKEELLYEVLLGQNRSIADLFRDLATSQDSSPVEQLRFLVSNHVKNALGRTRGSRLIDEVEMKNLSPTHRRNVIAARDEYEKVLCAVIERGIKNGCFLKTLDVKVTCYSIASMIIRTRVWYSPRGRLSVQKIADMIADFSLRLVTAEGGRLPRRAVRAPMTGRLTKKSVKQKE